MFVFILILFNLTFHFVLVISEMVCEGQDQCDLWCARCVDDKTRDDGKGKCKVLYPFMFDENCNQLTKCVDDCNNRGKCHGNGIKYVPWCDCDDFYHNVGCRNKSDEESNDDIVTGVRYTFQHIIPVSTHNAVPVRSTIKSSRRKVQKSLLTYDNNGGYYALVAGSMMYYAGSIIGNTHVSYHLYNFDARYPFVPYIKGSDNGVLLYKNEVLGYVGTFNFVVHSNGKLYYKNTYNIFVCYAKRELKCIAIIKPSQCSSQWTNPVTYYRSTNINIRMNVWYYTNGGFIDTSTDKPECVDTAMAAWNLWKLPRGPHKETLFHEFDYRRAHRMFKRNYKQYDLEFGRYKLLFEIKNIQHKDEAINFVYCYFNVISLPLVAVIDEGSERKIYKQHGLTLSAKRSHDPNKPLSDQDHVYIILRCISLTSPEKQEEMCAPRTMKLSEEAYISPHMLTYGATYRFTVEVRTEFYNDCEECSTQVSPTYAYADIQVLSETDELPYEVFIKCVCNCEEKVLLNTILFLKAEIKENISEGDIFRWTYSKNKEDAQSVDAIRELDTPFSTLIIKENTLDYGENYTIHFEVTRKHSGSKDVELVLKSYLFETVKIEYKGSCSVEPSSGTKGGTLFNIVCTYDPGPNFMYAFYDKSAEEAEENVIFSGRMLGYSYTGQLEEVILTRGDIFVSIIDNQGVMISKHINVQLSDDTISKEKLTEMYKKIEKAIKREDSPEALRITTYIADVTPPEIDKEEVLNKLLYYITKVPPINIEEAKMHTSAINNVLLTLNTPNQISLSPKVIVAVLRLLKINARLFSNFVHSESLTKCLPQAEIKQMAASMLGSVHGTIMSMQQDIGHMPLDGFPVKVLHEFRQLSASAEDTIEFVTMAISYLQRPGMPLCAVTSENGFFKVWALEHDDGYPITDVLSKRQEIPVHIPQRLYRRLKETLQSNTVQGSMSNVHLALQVVHIDRNIFWWSESDIRSNLVSVSLTSRDKQLRNRRISSLTSPLDIHMTLNNSTVPERVTDSTIQLDPNIGELELDLKIKIHRIDCPPRSYSRVSFNFPPTNYTLRVIIDDRIRPDYKMMMNQSINITQQSPKYPFGISNNDAEPNFVYIGIVPGPEVSINESVTYSYEVTSIICKFWARGHWSSVGCEVNSDSKDQDVSCLCTHVSIFAAAFPLPPQEIDPFADAKLFLTVLDNPLVVALVATMLLIHLLLCLLVWMLDRRDKKLGSVIVLEDNFPDNYYPYLLAVYTSSRFNAGTTAHVAFRLNGSRGNSRVHVLSTKYRKVLQKNSDDWFLIFCPGSLGALESLEIWHDNYGSSPAWFCDRIHVYDLKAQMETVFFVQQWIAFTLNFFPEAMGLPASEDEINEVKLLFLDNFYLGLREGHIWMSIFLRHPRTEVNRVQRLNILMCFIMLTMLCSIMFYAPLTEDSSTDDFEYAFGTREVYVSIQTLVICSVIAFILLSSFRRSYSYYYVRQQSSLYVSRESTYKYEISATASQRKISRTSFHMSSPPGSEHDFKIKKDPKLRDKNFFRMLVANVQTPPLPPVQLPPAVVVVSMRKIWFLIAWGFCITTILVCSYLVMLYGLKLGPVKSKEWASTVLASTGGDTFISSPAKIILFAIILTMAFQRMYDLNSHAVDYYQALRLKIPTDEKYVMGVLTRRQHPMYAPLSGAIRKEILRKKQLKNDWWTLIDFCISALFIVVISTVISNIWSSYYYTNSKVLELITSSHHPDLEDIDFFNIKSTTDMENFLEYTWMYAFYNTRWYNGFKIFEAINESDTKDAHLLYWAADYTNKLLGLPMVRQLRVKPKKCSNLFVESARCIPDFNKEDEDTDVYGVGWTPASWAEVMDDESAWKYIYKGSHFTLFRLYGLSGKLYERGGYFVLLGPTRQDVGTTLAELREYYWQDRLTRVVFVELTLYNVNKNLFSQVTIIVEYMVSGSIQLKAQVVTVENTLNFVVWMIILALYILFYAFRFLSLVNQFGLLEYSSSVINLLRLFIVITGSFTLAICVIYYQTLQNYSHLFQKQNMAIYFDFDAFTFYLLQLKLSLSILLCLAIARWFGLFRFGRYIRNWYYCFIISITWIFWIILSISALLVTLYFLTYYFNMFLIYNLKLLALKYRTLAEATPTDLEYKSVKLFVLLKNVSLNIYMYFFVILFIYNIKLARKYNLRPSDNFNLLYFLGNQLKRTILRK